MPSSVVSQFFYDGDKEILRVIFTSGLVYDYKNVPLEVYQAMKSATSKGSFLNRYVKGNFEFERREGDEP